MTVRARLAVLAVGLAGCPNTLTFNATLDTPGPVAVLHPDEGSPFDEPVGFVADRTGGRIHPLALARGTYLALQPIASFFRGDGVGTGRQRLLGDLVARVRALDTVDLIAVDRRFDQLLVIPFVVGRDATGLVQAQPRVAEQTWTGTVPLELDGLQLGGDAATSETWTLTWDGAVFTASGTRSGTQEPAQPDVAWRSIDRSVNFVPRLPGGLPAVGDTLTLVVDRGITEIALDAVPLRLIASPSKDRLVLTLADEDGVRLELRDPDAPGAATPVALPAGASPSDLAFTDDGTTLYVGDLALPAVHRVDPTTGDVDTLVVPWPVADVAALHWTDPRGVEHRELALHPHERDEVWLYDAVAGAFVDVNRWTPEVDPMRVDGAVNGMVAIAEPFEWPADLNERPTRGRAVAISLSSGKVVFMAEQTGCLIRDQAVPRTRLTSSISTVSDYEPSFDIRIPGTAYLEATDDPQQHVNVNPCAGVARAQTWSLTFDGIAQGWRVEGLSSGEQTTLAFEDTRYVSDDGEISLLIRSGPTPSQDGWTISFDVLAGTLQADGDNAGDLLRELAFDNPGPAAVYRWRDPDPTNGGRTIPFLVVSAQASDFVARVRSTSGVIDAIWD